MTPKIAVDAIAKNGALPFSGALSRKTMSTKERYAYEAYWGACARSKKSGLPRPEMSAREFMGWWLKELENFKGDVASCGRIDHSRGYFWNNIEMQDMAENSREGMLRNVTHLKSKLRNRKPVIASLDGEQVMCFLSIRDAANALSVSQRLVQFIIRGKYKTSQSVLYKLEAA